MPNSNNRGALGRRSGTITVIDEPVRRSAARTAKIAAIVVWLAVSILAATVTASLWPPVIALFAGVFIGLAAAALVAGVIVAWPVLRVIWWWSVEITAATALVAGWIELAGHTTLPVRLGAVALIAGPPAAICPVRRRILAVWWCFVTRHRIRACFSEFIITNRTGSLPLILWAWPTSVGERVWIWLRPGLALDDIQQRLDLIAVACWASSATVEQASDTNSARVRLDVRRRDALTATVRTPLVGLASPDTPKPARDAVALPTALDLPDVTAADVTPDRPPRKEPKAPASVPAISPVRPGTDLDDFENWI
jgi:hypothetical protein